MATKRAPEGAQDREPAEGAEPSFEQALERLEQIVADLEGGHLSLDDSLRTYEVGIRLSRQLTRTLEEAEKRIERLVEAGNGDLTTTPMELEGGEAKAPEAPRAARRPKPADPDIDELPF